MDKLNSKSDSINDIAVPRYSPRNPPKDYKENRAIGVFFCLRFSFGFGCPELLTAKIAAPGNIHIVPLVEYSIVDYYPPYHRPRKLHWFEDGTHPQPASGEVNSIPALGEWLKLQHPSCLCFRRGEGLNDKAIDSILQRLAQDFPFIWNLGEASRDLEEENCYRIILPEFKKKKFVHDLYQNLSERLFPRLR